MLSANQMILSMGENSSRMGEGGMVLQKIGALINWSNVNHNKLYSIYILVHAKSKAIPQTHVKY